MNNMFYRNEKGKLVFNRFDFEIFIADIIESIEPKNMKDLNWMIKMMIESTQLCASEYVDECDDIEDEWEDVYYLNDY